MNSYNKTEWKNGQAPALNAENLNKIENGIEEVTNEVINSVQKIQKIQMKGSTTYPNVDTAIENNVVYRVFREANGNPCGWLLFCGSKNYVDVEVTQIRLDMDGKLYRRKGIANRGTVTWESTWSEFDPDDSINVKMDLVPLDPSSEKIAAMPDGQFYGDTVNHKGTSKGGQSFYDTEYIDTALALKAPLSDFNTLSERAVQPAFIISHSNLHGYSSANALAENRAYAIYADVLSSEFSDLPAAAYGVTSYLMYYTSTSTRKQGIQLLNTPTDMWYRVVDGSGSGTWVPLTSSVQPANFLISHSNLHGYTDANSLDKNKVYAISADVTSSDFANLPDAAYGVTSYLTYYAYMTSRNHGVQLLQTATDMWYRTVSGTGSGTWVKIADVATVASEIAGAIESFAAKVVKPYGMTISHDETRGFTGANSLTQNNIYVIGSTVTSTEFTDLPSAAYGTTIYLLHYSYNATKKNGVQICTTSSKMWFRLVSNSAFGNWVELASQIDQNPNVTIDDYFVNTCVFKPISLDNNTGLFIFGDSITTDAHGGFTWGSLVAAKTGCTEYNFGVSGSAFVGYTAHPHTVMEQINSVPSGDWVNCDVCIVAAGTNDQKTENSAAGLRTAVQDVITAIKTNAPDAKIIFITPIRRESSGNNGLPMIAGAICNVALANECSVINGFDFPIPTHTNSWITELTDNDGLHPNVIGKKIYAQCVLNALL